MRRTRRNRTGGEHYTLGKAADLEVIITIIPIFAIIILGWGARKKSFITPEFLEPANKLVYYLSIPAMVFISIARSSFHEHFDVKVLSLTLLAATGIYSTAFKDNQK